LILTAKVSVVKSRGRRKCKKIRLLKRKWEGWQGTKKLPAPTGIRAGRRKNKKALKPPK
jgi:hypothetical protein